MSKVATIFSLLHDLSRDELQEVMIHGMVQLFRHPISSPITPSPAVLEAVPEAPGAPMKSGKAKKLSKKAMKALQESGAAVADAIASPVEPKAKKILSPEHLAALKAGREKRAAEKAAEKASTTGGAAEVVETAVESIQTVVETTSE